MCVLWIALANQARCQDIESTFRFAQSQYEAGNYDEAIKSYHRVLFFDRRDRKFTSSAYERMGDCFRLKTNFKEAANYYDLAYYSYESDSAQTEMALKKSAAILMTKGFDYALIDLLQMPERLPADQYQRKELYLGIAYFGLENFEDAQKHFLLAVAPSDSATRQAIQSEFNALNKIRIRPKTARILSLILPGLGQFYAGDVKNGLNSFVLCNAWLVLGAVIVRNYTLWDGVITAIPWYQRYYIDRKSVV